MSDNEEITQYTPPLPDKRRDKSVLQWLRDIVVSLVISAFVIVFVYQPVKVEGTSMMPGLSDQERIFINKYVYRWEPISRGDVVVFHYPYDPAKSYIKRIIGIAGDRVEIRQGWVYINDELLFEPYVASRYRDERSFAAFVVPEDSYFVLEITAICPTTAGTSAPSGASSSTVKRFLLTGRRTKSANCARAAKARVPGTHDRTG